MTAWTPRRWGAAAVASLAFALVVAVPTDLVDTPLFGREVPPTWWAWPSLDVSSLEPMLTWGTSPEDAAPITSRVPDPATHTDAQRREAMERSLKYMGLTPGMSLAGVPVQRVYIGSCTNIL